MITSIVLTDTHSIGLDGSGRFMVKEVKVSIKEVPFVRYRFKEYGDKELEYINKMKKVFIYSSHMAEITLGKDTYEVIERLESIDNIVKFVYLDIDNDDVINGLSEDKKKQIASIGVKFFDRLMLRDKSTTLDTVTADKLKILIGSIIDMDIDNIGICSSPLSFDGKNACLTAVKARELSAKYAENDNIALPSANHECMSSCGCIRYYVFDGDVKAPIGKSGGGTTSKSSTGGTNKGASKKSKGFSKWF